MLQKLSLFSALLIFSSLGLSTAEATILVNQPAPYPQVTLGSIGNTLYYAGNIAGNLLAAAGTIAPGYAFLNATSPSSAIITVNVDTDTVPPQPTTAGSWQLVVTLSVASTSGQIPLQGCVSGSNCFSGNTAAVYPGANSVFPLSFTLNDFCTAPGASGLLCTAYPTGGIHDGTFTQQMFVTFGWIDTLQINQFPNSPLNSNPQGSVTIGITDLAPAMGACPGSITSEYFPGDGQIYLSVGNFTASAGAGVPLQSVLAMAAPGTSIAAVTQDSAGIAANPIVNFFGTTQGQGVMTGFTNTTNGVDNQYAVDVQALNAAGIISPGAGISLGTDGCVFNKVQSQNINGVLKNSKCFIATAAYHDGRAAPVMMLRKFRDEVLSKYSLGRDFIEKYYEYSPALAEWAWDKPIIRSIALRALTPIELIAWAALKISHGDEVQPYIDQIKKELPPEDKPTVGSYSDQEKKKLEKEAAAENTTIEKPGESYSERVRKKILEDHPTEETSTGYTANQKTILPSEKVRLNPITTVKAGNDYKLGLGDQPTIKDAAGFKFGVSPGMQVISSGDTQIFKQVYGSGFQPEILFHYERQFFHSEYIGSFGLGADFGLAYSGGNGVLQFGFNGSTQSHTQFGFAQVPLIVNGTYRFNLLRILRPYASAGLGTILYDEFRNDTKPDRRGYTFVYQTNFGVSLLMDFFDSNTHVDGYLSNGIQHTYLFAEYEYLNSIASTVVFMRSGIYSGFLFEF